jgi:hypothetical protein
MSEKLYLPRFQAAIKPFAAKGNGTYWRYANGLLPAFGRWMVEHPEIAEALAADARALQTQRSTPESAAEAPERAI